MTDTHVHECACNRNWGGPCGPCDCENRRLAELLIRIDSIDPSARRQEGAPDAEQRYQARNALIFEAVAVATRMGIPAGIAIDDKAPDWPVVYIELSTGQVSWHLPAHPQPWDGHDGPTKTHRICDYAVLAGIDGDAGTTP